MNTFVLNVGDTVFVHKDLYNCQSAGQVVISPSMYALEGSFQTISHRYYNSYGKERYMLEALPRLVWALDFFDLALTNPSDESYEYW